MIQARYHVPIPGHATLEAVIDVQAYAASISNMAHVEVVIENSKIDTAHVPVKPLDAVYTSATVSVNGNTIATVSSSFTPEGVHSPFRAWYASTWVGGSDP
jgi:hypothetical protein